LIALILAGGKGTRFWPLSTPELPKQYLKLFEKKSMLKLTYERLTRFLNKENIFVITTHEQVPLIYDFLPEMNTSQIIAEPCGRNTAPCIALSIANFLWNFKREERVLVLPSDHYIPDIDNFISDIQRADNLAKNDFLVTFGIKPSFPATGYGYIEVGEFYEDGAFHVKQFKEKPDIKTAKIFIKRGNFLWNSGIFCFSIFNMINSFEKYNKEIFDKAVEVSCLKDLNDKRKHYSLIQNISIDSALFEKADNVLVLPASFSWSDVGNWSSFSDLLEKDHNHNFSRGKLKSIDSFNNSIFSKKKISLIGVKDLIVVETKDAILVCKKEKADLVGEY